MHLGGRGANARTELSSRSRRMTGIGWSRVDAIADSRCEMGDAKIADGA